MRPLIGATSTSDDPIDLLLDCHARIRQFTALARRLADATDAPPEQVVDAAERVARYFGVALPLHAADEEASLAPRLRGHDADLDRALAVMRDEHDAHDAAVAAVCAVCEALAADPSRHAALAVRLGQAADALAAHFDAHLAAEEAVVVPAARRLLDADARAAVLAEMRARRR